MENREGSGQWASRYAALGERRRDRLNLWVFGLLARHDALAVRLIRRGIGTRKPLIGVRPRRLAGAVVWASPFDIGHRIVFEEFFFDGSYALEKVPFIPDHIIDCGAHIGLFSMLAASTFPSTPLTAFEPNPANYDLLRRHLGQYGAAVDLRRAAVSTEATVARFANYDGCSGRLGEVAGGAGYDVEVQDLPALIRGHSFDRLLVKVDIEGEEQNLLPALVPVLSSTCALFFETHFGAARWDEAKAILEGAGFAVERLNFRNACADGFALRVEGSPWEEGL
jgi:FkbM family methyltransferase